MTVAITMLHPAVSALAFFQSTQLNLFEQFLTQAVSGIDSTSITSGMQNVAYVVLLAGFLWQIYQSALHGGDVRGLGTNLIKYIVTAIVVMNYHAVFTTINQGFVNAGNWISSASGAQNLFDNWKSDIQSQYNQAGFQQMWGLITGSFAGLIDALLIIVAYFLYPIVIVIFGFFYIFYGSVLYIFGPIVIALMPLGATNRLAKSYAENVFIWNAWPILYGGFGALLSAVQMGQVGQMLNQNNFLGGLGSVEGSVLIGIASIIYSLAIAVIPFIAKRIVSGEVGSTAAALIGAAGTALTAGIAAAEGAAAGIAATHGAGTTTGMSSGANATSSTPTGTTTKTRTSGNQPAPQQRGSGTPATATNTPPGQTKEQATPTATTSGDASSGGGSGPTPGERDAERIRAAMGGGARKPAAPKAPTSQGAPTPAATGVSTPGQQRTSSRSSAPSSTAGRPSMAPYRLSTWGAYHVARLATMGAVKGGRSASGAIGTMGDALANPTEAAGRIGAAAGDAAGSLVNTAVNAARGAGSVARHPVEAAQAGFQGVSDAISSTADRMGATTDRVVATAKESAYEARSRFTSSYENKREENKQEENG